MPQRPIKGTPVSDLLQQPRTQASSLLGRSREPRFEAIKLAVFKLHSMLSRLSSFSLGRFSSTDYKKAFLSCQCSVLSRALILHSYLITTACTGFVTSLTLIITVALLLQRDTNLVYRLPTSSLSSHLCIAAEPILQASVVDELTHGQC